MVLVVTRWFGGTKLGTAGLARAYGQAAADALAAAVIETRYRTVRLQISFPHDQTNAVMHAVARAGARVVGQSYDDAAHLTVELRMSRAAGLSAGVIEATRGRATVAALPAGPPAGAADGASGS